MVNIASLPECQALATPSDPLGQEATNSTNSTSTISLGTSRLFTAHVGTTVGNPLEGLRRRQVFVKAFSYRHVLILSHFLNVLLPQNTKIT